MWVEGSPTWEKMILQSGRRNEKTDGTEENSGTGGLIQMARVADH